MVGLSPPFPSSPGHPNSPGRRFANSVRSGVNSIDHGTAPEKVGQKTTKPFHTRLSSRWEVRSLSLDRQTARRFARPRCQPRRYKKLESACQSFL
jgi:hypothetical protein